MSNQLDQRIRRLVVEVVDTSPPAPPFGDLEPPTTQRRPTRIDVVAVAALTVIALAFGVAWFVRDERTRTIEPARGGVVTIPLRDVPQGVSPRTREGNPLFLVRRGKTVTTFRANDVRPHRSRWWCVDEKVFSSGSGDAFDRNGHPLTSPSTGLDHYPTIVRGGAVRIDLRTRVPDTATPPQQPFDAGIPCERKVVSGQQIDVRALPTLHYDTTSFHVAAGVKTFRFTAVGTHVLELTRSGHPVFTTFSTGRPTFRRVVLKPGRYEISCTIPGHRAAGMEATLVVTPK